MSIEGLLRELAPQVLAVLVRRHRRLDACEDAVQEALIAAAAQWPADGIPEHPRAWLVTVATRRLTDEVRSEAARRQREDADAVRSRPEDRVAPAAGETPPDEQDDTLALLFMCCHPALSTPSQIALTLRAVGDLTTAQIAAAFLVPEATMAQRISRGKAAIREAGTTFALPTGAEQIRRLRAVLHVLYLIFNEGYTATEGAGLQRRELAGEAIRLTRMVHARLPADGETAGLLALMLLVDARSAARATPDGGLIPLAEQDRGRWDRAAIEEGVALVTDALSSAPLGPYQLQAAIAAVHAEAPSPEATDWPQIVQLYRLLEQAAPNPMVTLNHAVAVGMAAGPRAGLDMLAALDGERRLAGHHRIAAVRAHLLERAGDEAAALAAYREAARRTTSLPEQRYLTGRAEAIARRCRERPDGSDRAVQATSRRTAR